MCFNLSYLTFLTVNSKEPIAAEAHITVFLVQRHTSSIIFAWRAFTRTLWKSDWDIKNAWKISPHFIPYITLIYKYINNPNSNLPSAKGVNIRFEAAQSKLKEPFLPEMSLFLLFLLIEERKFLKKSQQLLRAGRILHQPLMHQHLRIVLNAIKPNVICAKKKSPCQKYIFETPKLAANYFLDRGFHFIQSSAKDATFSTLHGSTTTEFQN